MKIGASYMGHHNPKHILTDIKEMVSLKMDDVLLAAQENDFHYFPGKIKFTAQIAKDHGIRPIAIFWGALNVFGGGQSSQFLLYNPDGFQKSKDGKHLPHGCYVNPICVDEIKRMIDIIAKHGYEGYFVDEPTPLRKCFCKACCEKFRLWHDGDLRTAPEAQAEQFRQHCVIDYVTIISDYCKANHPSLQTMCCLMPSDRELWEAAGGIASLDEIGTDIYWVNGEQDVEDMRPMIRDLDAVAKKSGKTHEEWLQCWRVQAGKEDRIIEQGKILLQEPADALYVWAWKGQIGTGETCANPELAWSKLVEVFRMAKEG